MNRRLVERRSGAFMAIALCAACGDAEPTEAEPPMTVGVVPYAPEPSLCPQGPWRESVYFRMDDENQTACSFESGDFGEGTWTAPQATKYPIPETCSSRRTHTMLRFCRTSVPDDAFKPLTTDPLDTAEFYALLKFGARCPAHSIEVSKVIVNEDDNTTNEPTGVPELLYPNEIVDGALGNFTRLVFCYFRNAPSAAETMTEFPDLGFPYAVFHDFEGPQPGWVIRKRWIYSDDSNLNRPGNRYHSALPEAEWLPEFSKIVENPLRGSNRDTYFDLARVR